MRSRSPVGSSSQCDANRLRRRRDRWAKFPALLRPRRHAAVLVLSALSVVGGLGAAAPATAADCVDSFDCFRLSYSFNNQAPFDQPRTLDFSTNNSAFTLEPNEHRTCRATSTTTIWGDKSAWWRFD